MVQKDFWISAIILCILEIHHHYEQAYNLKIMLTYVSLHILCEKYTA